MTRPSFMAQLRMPLIASPSAAEPMCAPYLDMKAPP